MNINCPCNAVPNAVLAVSLATIANLTGPANFASPFTSRVAVGAFVFTPNCPNESKTNPLIVVPPSGDVPKLIFPGVAPGPTGFAVSGSMSKDIALENL